MNAPRTIGLLALVALAGSIAGANLARAAGPFQPVPGGFVQCRASCSDAPLPGYATCFALRLVSSPTGLAQAQALAAAVSGYGPADLQSAYELPSEPRRRQDRRDRRRLRPADAPSPTSASTAASSACRRARPPTAASARSTRTAAPACRAANAGWGQEIALDLDMVSADLPAAARSCSSRPTSASIAEPRHRREPGRRARARSRSRTATAARESSGRRRAATPRTTTTPASRSPPRAGDSGYGRELPGRLAVRHLGRRHLALAATRTRAAGRETVWSRRRQRLLARTSRSRRSRPTPAAPRAHDGRRLRGRRPGTGVAVYDTYGSSGWTGLRRHERRRRRSSPSVYALATPPAAGAYPARTRTRNTGALFDVTSGSNGSCSPAYLCTAQRRLRRPDRPRHAERRRRVRPGRRRRRRTTSRSRSARPRARSRPGSGTTATVSTATTSGSAQSVSLSARAACRPARRASFSPASRHLGRLVDADALDVGLDARRARTRSRSRAPATLGDARDDVHA